MSVRLRFVTAATVAVGGVVVFAHAEDARLIRVPGSSNVLRVWEAPDDTGTAVPHYSVSFDGETFSEPRPTSYTLKLRHGDFDPLAPSEAPAIEEGFRSGPDTNLYIVQFHTQPLESFRAAIRDRGGAVRSFVANHAHVVRMEPAVRDAVEALPFVRWVGEFHPAYRLEEFMLDNADRGHELFPLQRYNIMVFEPGLAQKQAVAERIVALGGVVDRVDAGKYLLEATLTPGQLFEIVRSDEVLFVDRWGPFEEDMNISRRLTGANYIETQGGFTGSGVRGEVFDSGFNLSHTDFASRPLIVHGSAPGASHGASTSGIVFGDGTSNFSARGLLPDGQGIVAYHGGIMGTTNRYAHTFQLVQSPYFAVFQTSSVGSPRTTRYTTISANMDAALFDFDVVHCQSQSNAGNQMSRPQAWAKNIISGGGVFHFGTEATSDDRWSGGASTGPAADGRIKPTLTHFYDQILTTSYPGATAYTSNFGGTSGATPNICGAAGLFFQMWSDGIFGNPVNPIGTVFENRSHMSTAKAMLVNTARQYNWPAGGPNGDLNRFRQGWGLPDLQNMYDLRNNMLVIDETEILPNLGVATYTVITDGTMPLKATLVYADPPGVPFSSQHRINDLSLKVTAFFGTVFWGNAGLTSGIWSSPAGGPNTIDTVENVFIQNPPPGEWTIEVIVSELNADGHVETPALDADFALVVSGISGLAGCIGDVNGDLVVDVLDLLEVLANWGPCPGCPADINGDGVVNVLDLLDLLANWGPC